MRDSYNFGALRNQFLQGLDLQAAEFVNLKDFEHGLFPLAKELPGDDVRMVLGDGHDDLVPFPDERFTETGSDEVDGHRRPGGEHDLFRAFGVQEIGHQLSRPLVLLCCIRRQLMHGAMDVRVHCRCQRALLFKHGQGPLRGRRIVQIDKRLSVHLLRQGRELASDFLYRHTSLISLQIYIFLRYD